MKSKLDPGFVFSILKCWQSQQYSLDKTENNLKSLTRQLQPSFVKKKFTRSIKYFLKIFYGLYGLWIKYFHTRIFFLIDPKLTSHCSS